MYVNWHLLTLLAVFHGRGMHYMPGNAGLQTHLGWLCFVLPSRPPAPPLVSQWSRAMGCGLIEWCEAEACDSCARLPGWGLTHTASQGLRSRAAPPQLLATHTGPNCLQCCPWTCSPVGTSTGSAHCSIDVSVLCPRQAESFGLPVLYTLCA